MYTSILQIIPRWHPKCDVSREILARTFFLVRCVILGPSRVGYCQGPGLQVQQILPHQEMHILVFGPKLCVDSDSRVTIPNELRAQTRNFRQCLVSALGMTCLTGRNRNSIGRQISIRGTQTYVTPSIMLGWHEICGFALFLSFGFWSMRPPTRPSVISDAIIVWLRNKNLRSTLRKHCRLVIDILQDMRADSSMYWYYTVLRMQHVDFFQLIRNRDLKKIFTSLPSGV